MARGKTPEAHFKGALGRGTQEDSGIVIDKLVLESLEDGTKRNHRRQLDLWDHFADENLKLNLIQSFKEMEDFMRHEACSN